MKIYNFLCQPKKMSDAPLSLRQVELQHVYDYEHVAIKMKKDGSYDKEKHPGLTKDVAWLFHFNEVHQKWELAHNNGDSLFESHGWPMHQDRIVAYLSRPDGEIPYQTIQVATYNAQATVPLVAHVDYDPNCACKFPKRDIEGKTYFIVHGFTYKMLVTSALPTTLVDIMVIDGIRLSEIREERARLYNELLESSERHLSVDCEAGVFAVSLLATPMLTFKYDIESDQFVLKEATTSRLFMMYARDKYFVETVKMHIMKFYSDLIPMTPLYARIDNVTLTVSATVLELLHGGAERNDARAALHAYNLEILKARNLLKAKTIQVEGKDGTPEDAQLYFVDVLGATLTRQKELYNATFGKMPCVEVYSFMDEQ
jgi:hypothetical protein